MTGFLGPLIGLIMKKIDIIVATRNRRDKLINMIKSVWMGNRDHVSIMRIMCDGDHETEDSLVSKIMMNGWNENFGPTEVGWIKHCGSVSCRNLLCERVEDGILYSTDDIIFDPGSIDAAFRLFNRTFPDDDGVVGFVQNNSFHPTGIALVGQKFLQRYPNKHLFYHGYYHFAAQEVYELANKYGKFIQCLDARVFHFHPCFMKDQMDDTHNEARIKKSSDMNLMCKRKNAGLIWGDDGCIDQDSITYS